MLRTLFFGLSVIKKLSEIKRSHKKDLIMSNYLRVSSN